MRVEIRATYPATDGSMPEDVTVEIADIVDSVSSGEVIVTLGAVLDRMFAAPRMREITPGRPSYVGAKETES